MVLDSTGVPRLAVLCLVLGLAALFTGVAALSGEAFAEAAWGLDTGAAGANLVIVGAILAACGTWILWPRLPRETGFVLAGSLLAGGIALLFFAAYIEPLVTRIVGVTCLVTGARGAGLFLGELLPAWRHDGAMPLGEKTAIASLIANAAIAVYLLYQSQTYRVGPLGGLESGFGLLAMTVAVIVGVLVAETLVLRVLRGSDRDRTMEDERDRRIREDAGQAAHVLLVIGVVLIAVQFAFAGISERTALANEAIGLTAGLPFAHVLAALLFLSQCGRHIAQLWYYERARL